MIKSRRYTVLYSTSCLGILSETGPPLLHKARSEVGLAAMITILRRAKLWIPGTICALLSCSSQTPGAREGGRSARELSFDTRVESEDQHFDLTVLAVAVPFAPQIGSGQGRLPRHTEASLRETLMQQSPALGLCFSAGQLPRGKRHQVVLHLEVDDHGVVLGGSSTPGKGLEGVGKVAGCIVEAARKWQFAAREVPGTTILSVPLEWFEAL